MGQNGSDPYGVEGAYPNTRLTNPGQHVDAAGLDRQNGTQGNRPEPQAPPPPTGFQVLVQQTTDQWLPLYGHDLFRDPGTFASLPDAPPTTDYVVSTGDQVLVRMWGPVTMNEALTVDRSGNIYLPQVGTVHVAGLAYAALTGQIRNEVSRVFRNFNLSVDLGRLHSIQIFVTGQARRPGSYTVSSLSTLVNAVFASGGPSPVGSLRRIELRRDGAVLTTFDFYDLLLHGDKSKDVHLLPGDVIFIPPAGPQVAFAGQVNVPAIFELRGSETLGALLSLVGGPTAVASAAGVSVDQIVHHSFREARTLPLNAAGLATPLQDGELLILGSISNRFEKTVTIRGNLANPGRFAWHPGMRLSDIIPEKAALLTTRYWEVRNAEGTMPMHFEPLSSNANMQYAPGQQGQAAQPGQFGQSGQMGQMGQAGQSNQNQQASAGVLDRTLTNSSIMPQGSSTNNLGRSVNSLPEGGGVLTAGAADGGSSVQANPSDPRIAVATSQLTRVTIPAPEIDWTYAVIERTNHETLKNELFPFDLGKLVLDHDQSQNYPLEQGDVVTIFSQADFNVAQEQLTKYIRIEGEVGGAGVYSVRPGETLQSLVARAGGLTPQAYLFGSQLTRESARALEQQRLNQYVDKLSMEMERSAANESLSLAGNGNDASLLTLEERMLGQLRQQRATGRIVLDFKVDSQGVASIPPLSLENGDVLLIPSQPQVVNVVGSVPSQSSFLYKPKATVKYYLAQAGRPDRDSDPKHAFVIRANGSVLSRQSSGFWGNTFDGLELAPGDTLVVPSKLFKISTLRTVLAATSGLSSLAVIGALVN
ncbi:SLBB domain-containing protein [Acidipila sp. EB88]|uniref:polysaccharide biosynthesis/export family protein n=1 Tax=Acidipila sp. EB88 TaxID=2305226 RepID=UPI001315655E|nr:SLBB domain-containing protein [Acidipila sp. EB88]